MRKVIIFTFDGRDESDLDWAIEEVKEAAWNAVDDCQRISVGIREDV